jgi:hypothetical protein
MKIRLSPKWEYISLFVLALAGTLLFPVFWGTDTVLSQPKLVKPANPGDCSTCHGEERVLPKEHPSTTKMDLKTCRTCHQDEQAEGKKSASLSGRLSLSHLHALGGKDCQSCHGEKKLPEAENCLFCHGDVLSKKNKLNPSLPKPHDTHMGDLSCGLCHKAHGKSVNFCSQCHPWKYTVP